jgi:glucose-1-phosphate thymidylyltransferase
VKGLLLAGGHGTRLRPLTFTGNKHMIPIANQPILFYGLRHLAEAGIREVGVILGPIQEGIREGIGDGSAFGVRVTYIHQGDPKGLAQAVQCARSFLGDDPFVMYLGDNLLQQGVRPFVELFEREHPAAIVGATRVPDPRPYGVVELAGEKIVSIEEKPARPRSDLALIGVYLFTPAIHPIIDALRPSRRGELEITDAIWRLHASGQRVLVQQVSGWWKDTGHPEDLLEANDRVLASRSEALFRREGTIAPGARLRGHVAIGAGTVVEEGCEIEGPTVIGERVTVGAGTRIGAYTAIGDRVELRGAHVGRSIVLEGAVLEGNLSLRDSIVGRNVRIGASPGPRRELTLIVGDAAQIRL